MEKGICWELDRPSQIQFNKERNELQDKQIKNLNQRISQIIEQAPGGYLPKVYYGLQKGPNTYRFVKDFILNITIPGVIGQSYELYINKSQEIDYIPAIAVKETETTLKVIIQGDYISNVTEFKLINMTNGESQVETINDLVLTDASYLGELNANDVTNQNKQITVLNELVTGRKNIVYASIDLNNDGVFNWTAIGQLVNGTNGVSVYAVNSQNADVIVKKLKLYDSIVASEVVDIIIDNESIVTMLRGDIYTVYNVLPFTLIYSGNIEGPPGADGTNGAKGEKGEDGATPTIQEGKWFINGVDTGVIAQGQNGTNGTDGKNFQMVSGLWSVPANVGKPNNVDPEGNTLNTLPTLPRTGITGLAAIVYDPITTPLKPVYSLYFANDNDTEWTIVSPYNGTNGKDGKDGKTPYIKDNTWYIGDTNTGVAATGPQGPQGPQGDGTKVLKTGSTEHYAELEIKGSTHINVDQNETNPNELDIRLDDATATAISNNTTAITDIQTNKLPTYADKENTLTALNGKQDKLTAGENITIENNVISAKGGGGSSAVIGTYNPKFPKASVLMFKFLSKSNRNPDNNVWSDGEYYYYNIALLNPPHDNYRLNPYTFKWENYKWNVDGFKGRNVVNFRDNIYLINYGDQYVLNKETKQWERYLADNLHVNEGYNCFVVNNKLYGAINDKMYYLNVDSVNNKTWIAEDIGIVINDGYNVWNDGYNTYYTNYKGYYIFNETTKKFEPTTFEGLSDISGENIFSYNNDIYYLVTETYSAKYYILDKMNRKWIFKGNIKYNGGKPPYAKTIVNFYGKTVAFVGTNILELQRQESEPYAKEIPNTINVGDMGAISTMTQLPVPSTLKFTGEVISKDFTQPIGDGLYQVTFVYNSPNQFKTLTTMVFHKKGGIVGAGSVYTKFDTRRTEGGDVEEFEITFNPKFTEGSENTHLQIKIFSNKDITGDTISDVYITKIY